MGWLWINYYFVNILRSFEWWRLKQAGGLPEISWWLSEALRATPPVMDKKRMHPGGMPESHGTRLWHPSGMRFSHKLISGGIVRQASLNHRLISFKPPACPGDLAGKHG
jgi:hypothetical protein